MNPIDSINLQARLTGMALTRKAWILNSVHGSGAGSAGSTDIHLDRLAGLVGSRRRRALGLLIAIAVLLPGSRRDFQMALRDHLVMFHGCIRILLLVWRKPVELWFRRGGSAHLELLHH